MKRKLLMLAVLLPAMRAFAQTDTLQNEKTDTVKIGNFVIVKKKKDKNQDDDKSSGSKINITFGSNKKVNKSNVSTNWFIFDLGFANLRDETDYAAAQSSGFLRPVPGATYEAGKRAPGKDDFRLNAGKSSNVNIWFFMQKVNVSKHILNLKYGLGLEMYNYRYSTNISYNANPTYIFNDSVNFSKNKLYAGYLTVPFMVNVNTTPDKKRGFSFSAGVSAGYLVGSRQKQISAERGKEKNKSSFNLEQWRLAAVGELGLGPVRLYGSYSFNALHEGGLRQYPYVVGIRFSNW